MQKVAAIKHIAQGLERRKTHGLTEFRLVGIRFKGSMMSWMWYLLKVVVERNRGLRTLELSDLDSCLKESFTWMSLGITPSFSSPLGPSGWSQVKKKFVELFTSGESPQHACVISLLSAVQY